MARPFRSLALMLPLALAAACSSGDLAPTAPTAAAVQAAAAAPPPPVCLEFNVPALFTVFGVPSGDPPGTLVFVENGITVTTRRFYDAALNPYYNGTRIEPGVGWLGPDPSARLNNISLQFGFAGLPFVPSRVEFDYADAGGFENLTFNGTPLRIGDLDTLGGGAAFVAWWWAGIHKEGRVTVTGGVASVTVGGQELWIDSVCAYP